jgi:hypothetical protein
MRPSRDLGVLLCVARRRLLRLRALASTALTVAGADNDRSLSYVVIETHNLWGNFARSYTLSCLHSPARISKARVTLTNAAIQTPGAVLLEAARVQRGPAAPAPTSRRDEPPWHDVTIFLRTCGAIGCSHYPDVQSAMSLHTRVFQDLPAFRNFYAHRNEETAERAVRIARANYLITGRRRPSEVLSAPAYKRTQALILDWLDDVQAVMECLCE